VLGDRRLSLYILLSRLSSRRPFSLSFLLSRHFLLCAIFSAFPSRRLDNLFSSYEGSSICTNLTTSAANLLSIPVKLGRHFLSFHPLRSHALHLPSLPLSCTLTLCIFHPGSTPLSLLHLLHSYTLHPLFTLCILYTNRLL